MKNLKKFIKFWISVIIHTVMLISIVGSQEYAANNSGVGGINFEYKIF